MGPPGSFPTAPSFSFGAEENRVLFGFWRGKRLLDIELLKPGGKYEMATLELAQGDSPARSTVTGLARAAVSLNGSLGDPTALPSSHIRRSRRSRA